VNGGQWLKKCSTSIRKPTSPEKRNIVAIGGGGFAADGDLKIENYILKMTRVHRPSIGFIPTATGDATEYIIRFYDACSRLSCRPTHLGMFARTPDLREWVFAQHVIFVGGGNTKSMLGVWREWALDEVLRDAWESGVILSGVSAGAICWFEQGSTDSYANCLTSLDCLGFLSGSCCPHYDAEEERRPTFQRMLRERKISSGIALDNDSAAHFVGTNLHQVVSARPGSQGYRVYVLDGEVQEVPLKTVYLTSSKCI